MRTTLQLGGVAAANLGAAFLFQWLILIELGPGSDSDAMFASMALPQLVLAVVAGSLSHVLVPMLTGKNDTQLNRDAWSLIWLAGGASAAIAALLCVSASVLIPLTVPGFSPEATQLTVHLARIQMIGIALSTINGVQWAAYHARREFLWVEVSALFSNIVAAGLLFAALPRYGVVAAAWISTLRMVLQTALLTPGLGWPRGIRLTSAFTREGWDRLKPLMVGNAYFKSDPLVDRLLLSMSISGNLSLYHFAQQIYGAAGQILNKAIAAPLVPTLSWLDKTGKRHAFRDAYYRSLAQVTAITLTGLLLLAFAGRWIMDIVLGHFQMNPGSIADLWWILIWLSGVLVGGAAGQICASAFYAIGDTRTPTNISIATYTFYIPCKTIAFLTWNTVGLAIATTIYYLINLSIQAYLLEKRFRDQTRPDHSRAQ